MDNMAYIKVGSLFWIVQAIPEGVVGDTVTIQIKRLSDGYTWNFTTTAFASGDLSGAMTFISGILWKQSFTPPTEDTYIVTITDSTLDVSYVQVLKALGAVAQAGVTGTELTTLAHVKEFLGIPTATTTDDTFLQNVITRISDDIEKECGRTFHASDLTEYYNGDGTDTLVLKNFPINSIASIHDDTDRVYGSDSLISASDYIFYSDEGMIQLDGLTFMKGLRNVKVVYNAGYSTIPTDLEKACIQRVCADYLEAKGGINVVEGQDFFYKPKKLRDNAQIVIDRYKSYGSNR